MDRLISQQAAIEAVEFGITYAKAINKDTGEVRELFKQSNEELRNAVERIKQLPSAEPESISKWKKEFREYVDSLDIARDDWKGIIEYIDELPSAEPDTTTHDSIPAETGKNDGDGTSDDCISRQQAINKFKPWLEVKGYGWGELNMLRAVINELENIPSVQPERPKGEWIQKPRYEDDEYPDVQPNLKCPFCGYEIGWCDMGNYCARCGADLRGDENE